MSRTIAPFDPFGDVREMGQWMDRLFGYASPRDVPTAKWSTNLSLPVDIYERDNKLVVKAAVPGVAPEDLDIQIENRVLTIRDGRVDGADFRQLEGLVQDGFQFRDCFRCKDVALMIQKLANVFAR